MAKDVIPIANPMNLPGHNAPSKYSTTYLVAQINAYEIGTAKYLKHAQNVTPGEPGSEAEEYTNVSYFKVKDMREALKKVWGLQEEEKVKKEGEKTETGKKMAKVDTEPKMGA